MRASADSCFDETRFLSSLLSGDWVRAQAQQGFGLVWAAERGHLRSECCLPFLVKAFDVSVGGKETIFLKLDQYLHRPMQI